ncbi:MAG: glycosyl hydrolase family 28-related protein [Chloroflexia bacterium]
MSEPFVFSTVAKTGRVHNIASYGATSNNSADDDAAAVRKAVAAAVSGDEVYMPDGVYHFKTINVNLKAGVSLRGQSRSATVISTQFAAFSANYYSGYVVGADGSKHDLTISNFRILKSAGQPANYGVLVSDSRRVTVRDLQVEGWKITGIGVIKGGKHVIVRDNDIRNGTSTAGGEGYAIGVREQRQRHPTAAGSSTLIWAPPQRNNRVRHGIIIPIWHTIICSSNDDEHHVEALTSTLTMSTPALATTLSKAADTAASHSATPAGSGRTTPQLLLRSADNWVHWRRVGLRVGTSSSSLPVSRTTTTRQ